MTKSTISTKKKKTIEKTYTKIQLGIEYYKFRAYLITPILVQHDAGLVKEYPKLTDNVVDFLLWLQKYEE